LFNEIYTLIDTLCAQMIIYTKVLDIIRIRGNTLYGHKKFFSMIYSNNIQPGNCILYLMFSNGISFEYKYQINIGENQRRDNSEIQATLGTQRHMTKTIKAKVHTPQHRKLKFYNLKAM
jgi:outer membrane protein W